MSLNRMFSGRDCSENSTLMSLESKDTQIMSCLWFHSTLRLNGQQKWE